MVSLSTVNTVLHDWSFQGFPGTLRINRSSTKLPLITQIWWKATQYFIFLLVKNPTLMPPYIWTRRSWHDFVVFTNAIRRTPIQRTTNVRLAVKSLEGLDVPRICFIVERLIHRVSTVLEVTPVHFLSLFHSLLSCLEQASQRDSFGHSMVCLSYIYIRWLIFGRMLSHCNGICKGF